MNSTAATSTVNITAVDDAPVVTAGATVGFTEQGSAVVLDSGLTLSDADNTTLASATVSISSGFFAGDTLNFTNQNGITGSYDSGTGVLTLTGTDTVADYQAALRSITFSSASDNPTNFGADTSRTITWTANDGALNSAPATSTVNVTAVNDAPVLLAGATVGYTEQGTAAVLDSGLTLSDADNTTLASATVSITSGLFAGDTLNFTNQNGITGSYDGSTGVLTLTGSASVANYQAALRSITFSSPSDNPTNFGSDTSRTITWTGERRRLEQHGRHQHGEHHGGRRCAGRDGGGDGRLHRAGHGRRARFRPDAERRRQHDAGERHGVDQLGLLRRRHAELHQPERHHRQLRQRHRCAHPDRYRHARALPGSTALDHLLLGQRQPHQLRRDTSRTITWQANDGALNSTAATSTVNVTAINDAPVLLAGATVGYTEQGTAAVLDSGLTLSDADNTTLAGATVSISSGLFAGDTLNFTNQNGITGSYDGGTGVLTLTGSASVANYQAALRSITFSSPSDNPTNFGSDTSRTITWQANDGA